MNGPVDAGLFARTAPAWNCVDYPGDGMHYINGTGDCAWCGMTREQIAAEHRAREERGTMAVIIKRDGKQVAEVADDNAAFEWILKHQGQSVSWALRWEGYSVHGPDGKEDPSWDQLRNQAT